MADMQTNEAVERAKDRLQEVANQKAGITAERKPETLGDKPKTKADMIKPVDKKPKKKGADSPKRTNPTTGARLFTKDAPGRLT